MLTVDATGFVCLCFGYQRTKSTKIEIKKEVLAAEKTGYFKANAKKAGISEVFRWKKGKIFCTLNRG
jgi:hypothetical protein